MRKLSILFAVLLLVGVLLLSGCNAQADNVDAEQEDALVGYTVYLDNGVSNSAHAKVREFDVRLVGDKGFFPTTYEANVGDTVRLFFAFQDSYFVTIEELGIGTDVKSGVIEFVPKQAGVFEMVCVNCDPSVIGWIVVN